MDDQVCCADGFVYNRASLEAWLERHGPVSPKTGAALPHTHATPSHAVRSLIAARLPGFILSPWRA